MEGSSFSLEGRSVSVDPRCPGLEESESLLEEEDEDEEPAFRESFFFLRFLGFLLFIFFSSFSFLSFFGGEGGESLTSPSSEDEDSGT